MAAGESAVARNMAGYNIGCMPKPSLNLNSLLGLSAAEKVKLIGELWDSLSPEELDELLPVSEALGQELDRRAAAVREGNEEILTYGEARRRTLDGTHRSA